MNKIASLLLCFVLMSLTSIGQNTTHPNGVSFKALFMDYQSQNGGGISNFKDYHHGFEIGYLKNIQPNLNLVVPLKIGVVNSQLAGELESLHKTIFGLDAQIQYQFWQPNKKVTPYIMAGLGGVGEQEGSFNLQAPLGLGFQFSVAKNAYVNYQTEYRFSFSDNRNNLQHGIGFVYLFGDEKIKPLDIVGDTDGDGIIDSEDLCPKNSGPLKHNGCPDTDGDDVPDFKDKCVDLAGLVELDGCPDTDGDGIIDPIDDCPNTVGIAPNGCPEDPNTRDTDGDGIPNIKDACPDVPGVAPTGCPGGDRDNDGTIDQEDRCPDVAGSPASHGCPDRDGDGIADIDDQCPSSAGPAAYNGCPDTDGDGLHDGRDRCPNSFGLVSTGGCPEIEASDKRTLDIAMRAVQFDTGRSTLRSESFDVLRQIADIMRRYPDYILTINGHTDNTGKTTSNQQLSERRAKACYQYLGTLGIDQGRMSYVGYGESRPIANNNTLRGRTLNRRVEFNLIPGR